jgi:FkbM family methyltransferase
MEFYYYFRKIISEAIAKRDNLDSVISRIKSFHTDRKIAFYPSGILTSLILKEIKEKHNDLLPRIVGCFDRSKDATTEEGVPVFPLDDLDSHKEISVLTVPSNTFSSKEKRELELTRYNGDTIYTSFFHISLPTNISDEEIIRKMDTVYSLLSDNKSKATYMTAWLSRMLNDETLTNLFESEENIDEITEPLVFKDFVIKGLDHICKKELQSELYKMKHVSPEKGNVVLDIGAYKGDTAIFFANCVGENGKVYAFEPVKANIFALEENARNNRLENIIVPVNMGVSSKSGVLKVVSNSYGAPWSFLSEQRGNETEITTIDNFVRDKGLKKVDFIKMDVEGVEADVIAGAKDTIKKFSPKIAIAAYHKTSDLFELPLILKNIENYEFFMRSKVEGPFGFTFYCRKK